jgi:NAD(P)H dehydrogenase (quinone)
MHAHIVLAHPEPKSYNAHLTAIAKNSLEDDGWTVSVSDLYSMKFDPAEKADFYPDPLDETRFNVQAEQRHASEEKTLSPEIKAEIEKLDAADLLILQYPMWWHLPPAMLKGWFDRVLVYGEVYTSKKRFENGRFAGKKAMLSVTVGTSQDTYAHNGRSGDIDLMLWPVNFTLAFVGYTVLNPFVAYSVESTISYSNRDEVLQRLQDTENTLASRVKNLDAIREVPFNKMSEWGADGRIVPTAPAYSPYIRHNETLKLDKE